MKKILIVMSLVGFLAGCNKESSDMSSGAAPAATNAAASTNK